MKEESQCDDDALEHMAPFGTNQRRTSKWKDLWAQDLIGGRIVNTEISSVFAQFFTGEDKSHHASLQRMNPSLDSQRGLQIILQNHYMIISQMMRINAGIFLIIVAIWRVLCALWEHAQCITWVRNFNLRVVYPFAEEFWCKILLTFKGKFTFCCWSWW